MSDGINIGDAVLTFLGDSSQLDMKLDEVQPKTEKAFAGAADAVEEGTERMTSSMAEARGEVALLGEEFGIHLPRHIRSFIAELPGVGEAMSAAFSATAVIFIAQALVQATDKLSNFLGETLVFTDGMKESNAEIAHSNQALESLNKQREAAVAKLEQLKGVTQDEEAAQIAATRATVAQARAELEQLKVHVANKGLWEQTKDTAKDYAGVLLSQLIPGYARLTSAVQDQIKVKDKEAEVNLIAAQAAKAEAAEREAQAEEQRQKAINNQLQELENQKKVALAYAQTEQEKYEFELAFGEKRLALLKSLGDKEKSQVQAQLAQIEVLQVAHEQKIQAAFIHLLESVQQAKSQALDAMKDSVVANTIAFTPAEQAMERFTVAARNLGITLKDDLVNNLNKAREAENAFISAGLKQEGPEWQQIQNAITSAQKALDNFGKTQDNFLAKSKAWREFQQQLDGASHGIDQVKLSGAQAFDSLESSVAGAFQALVLGQQNVGRALEQATAQALASIASQAAVKALFYTAEGFAALAGFMDSSATEYFTAAGEMAAVAVAAGAAGRALSSAAGSGSGTNNEQLHSSVSNTTSQGGGNSGVVGVQHFATGGLISAPTIALAGERGREAVLPLEDPRAMSQIGQAIGQHGGTTHHWHIDGMISSDNLVKVVKQINRMVNKGQVSLLASNSFRLTKRSA